MKNKKIILILILLSSILITQKTFALKKAVFPDEKSLQPIQLDVRANISGNINNSTTPAPMTQNEVINAGKDNISQNKVIQNNATSNDSINTKSTLPYIVFILIVLLIVFSFYFIYRKAKQK